MNKLNRLAIFCGANAGFSDLYANAAQQLVKEFAEKNIALVYGGGKVGIMGAIANTMIELKQEVIGVIPQFLVDRELAHEGATTLEIVSSMHERKARMEALSDGFILLPGGFGSLDEFFEILTWGQLGLHSKPCGILNVDGYYSNLAQFLKHSVDKGFIDSYLLENIIIEENPCELLARFEAYQGSSNIPHIQSLDQV